jgi:citrate lyase subunit gamma (acyl carrier protein)
VLFMEITRPSKAGTMESNDIYVMVQPNDNNGILLELDSIVIKQFGKQIEKVIREVLNEFDIKNIKLTVKDRGALDYTIKARIETAIKRAV